MTYFLQNMKLSSLVNINKLYLKKIKKNELEKLRNERNSHEVRKKMLTNINKN